MLRFLLILLMPNVLYAGTQHHLILKSDLNNDGVADRIVYASSGISGYYLSRSGNKKIDTFSITQGNQTIFYSIKNRKGGGVLRLEENFGLYKVVQLYSEKNNKFNLNGSYILPNKTYFNLKKFSSSRNTSKDDRCGPHSDAINELKKNRIPLSTNFIDDKCKSIYDEKEFKNLKSLLEAEISSIQDKSSEFVNCLDEISVESGSKYYEDILKLITDDKLKITCENSNGMSPVSSLLNPDLIVFFKTKPEVNDNFVNNFRHEMVHKIFPEQDNEEFISKISNSCSNYLPGDKTVSEMGVKYRKTDEDINKTIEDTNNKVVIPLRVTNFSNQVVSDALSVGSSALDRNFSTDNEPQFISLENASKKTFKTFAPLMDAAFKSAVPVAFAGNKIQNKPETSTKLNKSAATNFPEINIVKTDLKLNKSDQAPSRMPAAIDQGIIISKPTLPESVDTRDGSLGNGMKIKIPEISIKNPSLNSTLSKNSSAYLNQIKNQMSEPEMKEAVKNVPSLKDENDFLQLLTAGNYKDVKTKLDNPQTHKLLEKYQIQYLSRAGTFGSNDPALILRDLGNGFSIRRVVIE